MSIYQAADLISNVPVKVLPKTSSSGGTSSFGVILFVIDSFDGSMPGNVGVKPALYVRLHCQLKGSLEGTSLLADERTDLAKNRLVWRSSILSDQLTISRYGNF